MCALWFFPNNLGNNSLNSYKSNINLSMNNFNELSSITETTSLPMLASLSSLSTIEQQQRLIQASILMATIKKQTIISHTNKLFSDKITNNRAMQKLFLLSDLKQNSTSANLRNKSSSITNFNILPQLSAIEQNSLTKQLSSENNYCSDVKHIHSQKEPENVLPVVTADSVANFSTKFFSSLLATAVTNSEKKTKKKTDTISKSEMFLVDKLLPHNYTPNLSLPASTTCSSSSSVEQQTLSFSPALSPLSDSEKTINNSNSTSLENLKIAVVAAAAAAANSIPVLFYIFYNI